MCVVLLLSLSDLLADVFHLGLLIPVHILPFLDESQEFFFFAPNQFFSVRCRHNRVLLLCFTNQFLSLRFRRRHVLLLLCFTIHFFSLRCCRRRGLPLSFFCLLICCCFMLANEPLFKFIISSLDFVDYFC